MDPFDTILEFTIIVGVFSSIVFVISLLYYILSRDPNRIWHFFADAGCYGLCLSAAGLVVLGFLTIGKISTSSNYSYPHQIQSTQPRQVCKYDSRPHDTLVKSTKPLPMRQQIDIWVDEVCALYPNVRKELVMGVISVESNFQQDVIGGGAWYGLMQVDPKWHSERMDRLGVTDLLDPHSNILVGVDILSELITKYGNEAYALMAYNGGPAYANRMIASGSISEYASYILRYAEEARYG